MDLHRFFLCLALLSISPLPSPAPAQDQSGLGRQNLLNQVAVLQGKATAGPYLLPDQFILMGTERIDMDGLTLIRGLDYGIDYDAGEITFVEPVAAGKNIIVTYQRLPLGLQRSYFRRRLVQPETTDYPQVIVLPGPPAPPLEGPELSTLRIGGSKSLGISLGSDRDLSLEQSLRFTITGQITKDIDVVAMLSDQSSPLQPEGTTQTLEELDKVAIELHGKHVQATFGDYSLSYQDTEFGRFDRKLQGARGRLSSARGQVEIAGASARGTFTTNRFLGEEGNQGPYQLADDQGSVNITVLAGTERVWIDGELMARGETADYTIEYANGQITFTRRRLITAESRIVIDFEYISEKYRRSLLAGSGDHTFAGNRLRTGFTFYRETDDREDPLSLDLSDSDRTVLAGAGDDEEAAFHYADDGSTKVYLPLPRRHDLADMHLGFTAGMMDLSGELGLSRYDANTFSDLDDGDNRGEAVQLSGRLTPPAVSVANRNIGRLEVAGLYRRLDSRFREIGRRVPAEYDRRWNLPSGLISTAEEVGELGAVYSPHPSSSLGFGLGRIERGRLFQATRNEFRTDLTVQGFPQIHYLLERIESHDRADPDSAASTDGDWTRHDLRTACTVWKLRPTFNVEGERKDERQSGRLTDGFKFYEIESGLSTSGPQTIQASTGFSYRRDWDFDGLWLEASESRTLRSGLTVREWKAVSASADYTHRKKQFLEQIGRDQTTNLADIMLAVTHPDRGLSSSLRYQISSLQAATKERRYIDVGEWKGTYRYDDETGEYVYDPGKKESRFLLRTLTVGDFEPVIELKAKLNLKTNPARLFGSPQPQASSLLRWLDFFETETWLTIEEQTREKDTWAIYLLNLGKFQQDSTTITGHISVRQDIFLFPRQDRLNIRLRYERSDDEDNQLTGGNASDIFGEKRLRAEESLRLRSRIAGRFDLQADLQRKQHRRKQGQQLTYDIHSNSFAADIGYRPRPHIEVSLRSEYGLDADHNSPQRSTFVSLSPGCSYTILRRGRVRTEFSWTHVEADRADLPLLYTMAGGKKRGDNYDWSFNLDYRLHQYVTALISYTGRSEPDRQVTHTGRAEMRAFF